MTVGITLDPEVAKKIGVGEAIVHQWVSDQYAVQKALGQLIELEKQSWMKVSLKAMALEFPFWTERNIKKLLEKVSAKGLVIVSEFDSIQYCHPAGAKKARAKKEETETQIQLPEEEDTIRFEMMVEDGIVQEFEETPGKIVNMLINEFRHVNPAYNIFFSRKAERNALMEMIKTDRMDVTEMFLLMRLLPQTNTMRYAPKITSPSGFRSSAGRLIAFIQSERLASENSFKVTY